MNALCETLAESVIGAVYIDDDRTTERLLLPKLHSHAGPHPQRVEKLRRITIHVARQRNHCSFAGLQVDETARARQIRRLGCRNRKAVRTRLRLTQRTKHAVFHLWGDVMLKLERNAVSLLPGIPERFSKEPLDNSMATDYPDSQNSACAGELDSPVGPMNREAPVRETFDAGGHCAWRQPETLRYVTGVRLGSLLRKAVQGLQQFTFRFRRFDVGAQRREL